MNKNFLHTSRIAGVAGALLLFFIGWEYNIPLAGWVAYPLLVYCFRTAGRWYRTLPIVLIMAAVRFLSIHGGWDMDLWLESIFSVVVLIPLLAALYLDRIYVKRLDPMFATLVFPCTFRLDFPGQRCGHHACSRV